MRDCQVNVYFMSFLDSFESRVKGIVCTKGIVKVLHMRTHLMIFFWNVDRKQPLEDMYVFRKKARLALSGDIEGYFQFENS